MSNLGKNTIQSCHLYVICIYMREFSTSHTPYWGPIVSKCTKDTFKFKIYFGRLRKMLQNSAIIYTILYIQ